MQLTDDRIVDQLLGDLRQSEAATRVILEDVEKDMTKLQRDVSALKKALNHVDKATIFASQFGPLQVQLQARLSLLQKDYCKMLKEYCDLLTFFGESEPSAKTDKFTVADVVVPPEEFYGIFNQFSADLTKARAEIKQKREQEEKQAKRQEAAKLKEMKLQQLQEQRLANVAIPDIREGTALFFFFIRKT